MFEVRVYPKFGKDSAAFHTKIKERLKTLINGLAQNPVPTQKYNVRSISGKDGAYR